MTGSGVTLLEWKPVRRCTLCGFSVVRIDRISLVVADVAVHQKNRSRWTSLPSNPLLHRNGSVLHDEHTDKIRYELLLQWADRKTADRFSAAVHAELLARYPPAFDGGAP